MEAPATAAGQERRRASDGSPSVRHPVREIVLEVLAAAGRDTSLGPGEIARRGGVAPTAVRKALGGLVERGAVALPRRGQYRLGAGAGESA